MGEQKKESEGTQRNPRRPPSRNKWHYRLQDEQPEQEHELEPDAAAHPELAPEKP